MVLSSWPHALNAVLGADYTAEDGGLSAYSLSWFCPLEFADYTMDAGKIKI